MKRFPAYSLPPALLVLALLALLAGLSFVPVPVDAHAHDRHLEFLLRLLSGDAS